MLLAEYAIVFMTRKAIKRQYNRRSFYRSCRARLWASRFWSPWWRRVGDQGWYGSEWVVDTLFWWSSVLGNGVGTVIISPNRKQYPFLVRLLFECTNNTAEYEASILGLEVALEHRVKKLEVFGGFHVDHLQSKRRMANKRWKVETLPELPCKISQWVQRDQVHSYEQG